MSDPKSRNGLDGGGTDGGKIKIDPAAAVKPVQYPDAVLHCYGVQLQLGDDESLNQHNSLEDIALMSEQELSSYVAVMENRLCDRAQEPLKRQLEQLERTNADQAKVMKTYLAEKNELKKQFDSVTAAAEAAKKESTLAMQKIELFGEKIDALKDDIERGHREDLRIARGQTPEAVTTKHEADLNEARGQIPPAARDHLNAARNLQKAFGVWALVATIVLAISIGVQGFSYFSGSSQGQAADSPSADDTTPFKFRKLDPQVEL